MATQNMIFLERIMHEFDTLFDYIFQEGPNLNIININIIKSECGVSIDQTDHIIKKIRNIGEQIQKMR